MEKKGWCWVLKQEEEEFGDWARRKGCPDRGAAYAKAWRHGELVAHTIACAVCKN